MGATPSPAQSKLYAGLLPVELSAEAPTIRAVDLNNDWFASEPPSSSKRPLPHFLIIFCIGVAATLAWQSYSDAARQIIARLSPQLGWLAPHAAVAQTAPDRIEQITQNVGQIASSIVASQEQMTRSVDQLAAGQEQMTREIIRLQAISQYALYKNSEPPLRPTPAPAPKPVTRSVR
jgi:flagellin-like hook-associated protein FlgL